MRFMEIDKRERTEAWSFYTPQCHTYYELYFLLKGKRRVFLNDKAFNVEAPALCVIPPFRLHRMEGEAYTRININVHPDVLTAGEKAFLQEIEETGAYKLNGKNTDFFLQTLEIAAEYKPVPNEEKIKEAFAHVLLHLLQDDCLDTTRTVEEAPYAKTETTILKIATYIHEHYAETLTVTDLCSKFYISKNTLCAKFRAFIGCSVMQYHSFVRINKAKELLAYTKKSIERIAEECGYSSANYFSLIFKKEVGLSPAHYRKAK